MLVNDFNSCFVASEIDSALSPSSKIITEKRG